MIEIDIDADDDVVVVRCLGEFEGDIKHSESHRFRRDVEAAVVGILRDGGRKVLFDVTRVRREPNWAHVEALVAGFRLVSAAGGRACVVINHEQELSWERIAQDRVPVRIGVPEAIASWSRWQADPKKKHRLHLSDEPPSPADKHEVRWIRELVDEFRDPGAVLRQPNRDPALFACCHTFAISSSRYTVNGEPQRRSVFVSRDNPNMFIVVNQGGCNWVKFVVDFEAGRVAAPAWGTVYAPPSRTFCLVALASQTFDGVPVQGPANPAFEPRSATWY